MLKITGKQRYGTQVTCAAGMRVPQPLEDEAQLASRRASVNLQPIGDYLKFMDEHSGNCPDS